MESLLNLTNLPPNQFVIVVVAVFIAGMVRGFAGFALSALVMASVAIIIPPVQLIAICWFLELSASLLMVRGGFKEGNKKVVLGLVVGAAVGSPIGLYLTNTLPIETSKMVALALVLVLAALQLLRVRARFLATTPGLYISGLFAGIATGLASLGGMVVALYVLARDAPSREMRGSLVMFLFLSSLISAIYLTGYGMFDKTTITRGLIFAVPCLAGVVAGKALFTKRLEPYYKPFCLCLLMLLAGFGLVRMAVGF